MSSQESNEPRPLRVTIIYMVEERTKERIHCLCEQLRDCGIDVFMFSDDMTLVESHAAEMQKQIENADVVIICYSENFDNEGRGYRHQEVRIAKEEQRKRPPGNAYLITINLDRCPVPPYLSEARVLNYFRKEHFKGIMGWGLMVRRDQLIKKGEKIQVFKYSFPQQEHEQEHAIDEEAILQYSMVDQVKQIGVWHVPYLRNPYFTGRDEFLDQIHQHFSRKTHSEATARRQTALAQPLAIKGLGGVGKTQIVVEYAYRSRDLDCYTHTLWINSASEEAIIASFVTIAELLPAFLAKEETDQEKIIDAVKRWLERCEQPWLLIFDNVEDVLAIHEYLPQWGNGCVLLTTRANAPGSLAVSLEVETMGWVEGTELLLRRAQRSDQATDEERNEAGNIVVALDHFPLALDQAGAYIEETKCGLVGYLQIYQTHRKELLEQRGDQAMNYPDSVATTWLLSFQKVEQSHPAAAELLRLCAMLAPDQIPDELIINGANQWGFPLQQSAADLSTFNAMMKELLKYSLVHRLSDNNAFSIHRLVQAVQMDMMKPEVQRQWAERAVWGVNEVFPLYPSDVTLWSQCLCYLDQAQSCHMLIEQYQFQFMEAAHLLLRTGDYLEIHALYSLAEPLLQRALSISEQVFGNEHPDTATSLNSLATLYQDQGKYAEAEPLYERALCIREQQLGIDDSSVAISLNSLATLYQAQGKYAEAEPLYKRALRIDEQQWGVDHHETMTCLNNLATLYYAQGKYAEAEPLYECALRIREQQWGVDHYETMTCLNNLAALYQAQGKYAEAEPLCVRALRISEQQLGTDHSSVATSLNSLATLYQDQGKNAEAEPLYERALHIREQRLGADHPNVAVSLNNLALLYQEQGEYAKAEPLYERALRICEQQLGADHPDTAASFHSLATLYQDQGKYVEAEPLYKRALYIYEQQLGLDHPQTQIVHKNYAILLQIKKAH